MSDKPGAGEAARRIVELQELLGRATRQWPEEWVLERDGAYASIMRKGTPHPIVTSMGRHQAALAVELRNAAPFLIDDLLSLSKRIEELEKAVQKLWMTAVLVSDNELAVAQDALETIQATLRHHQRPQDVTFHRGLHALRNAREVLAKMKEPTP